MRIKNIVFDIGNVLVAWQPQKIVAQVFPEQKSEQLTQKIFKSELWLDVNRGKLTERALLSTLEKNLGIEYSKLAKFMESIRASLEPIPGSQELLKQLYDAQWPLYALTDNTHEILAYLRQRYTFWQYFKGVVSSAEIGVLKPSPQIYQHLLQTYGLVAEETLFLDDLAVNIQGARALGMQGIVFNNTPQALAELRKFEVLT